MMTPGSLILTIAAAFVILPSTHGQDAAGTGNRLGTALHPEEKSHAVGPWGHLEFYQLVLEPSDFFLAVSSDLRTWREGTVWRFSALNADGVEGILENAGIKRELREILLSDRYMTFNSEAGIFEIRPPEDVIIALDPESRGLLYPQILPFHARNPFHTTYALPVGGLDKVTYVSTGVPQEQLDLIKKLSYKRGNTTQFADIRLVFSRAQSEDERHRIIKTIARERSLSVKLRITEENNLSQLANYWSAGGKNKEILPMLESIMMTSGIETLDLVHLLPPTPRKLLNSYPSEDGSGLGNEMPDCYWTAASFFSEDPPDRFLDSIAQVIDNRYEKASRPLQLGDFILLTDKQTGRAIHACNYIAGNLIYTKNGKSLGRPWIISSLEDVVEEYLSVEEMSLTFLRLKPQYRK
ncbi:MAG: hypothetical protein P1U86_04690 [Verrucomicrobiales bacterium]|nr:hypothetical protein [Verrucomicrobiales bacterium]